jgi:predicted nuclease of predicted toxin-antitoxin system
MPRLAFCADEHVPAAFVTALESNDFSVTEAVREHDERTVDERLLAWCGRKDYALLTNDRDFVQLVERIDHSGVVLYTTQGLTPGNFARGIRRIDRQFAPEDFENTLVWLENWL